MPSACAAWTIWAAATLSFGMTTRTSTPCVSMFSACAFCRRSSPSADCTITSAPSFSASALKMSLSFCQRSTRSESMESPILIFFAGGSAHPQSTAKHATHKMMNVRFILSSLLRCRGCSFLFFGGYLLHDISCLGHFRSLNEPENRYLTPNLDNGNGGDFARCVC